MQESIKHNKIKAKRRARRGRAKMQGTDARPRLSLHISLSRMYAQCIDDTAGKTLAAASDIILGVDPRRPTVERAAQFGRKFAELAKEKSIARVFFDRGSRAYHGRVKAFAQGAREGGLEF